MQAAGWAGLSHGGRLGLYPHHGVYGLAKGALILLTEHWRWNWTGDHGQRRGPGQIVESGPDISAIDPTSSIGRSRTRLPDDWSHARSRSLIAWLCSRLPI